MIRYIYLSIISLSFSAISCTQNITEVNQKSKDAAIEIAVKTQKALGKGLKQAIQQDGVAKAISFCNDTAEVITLSVANILNADIKRVSDKNRNPNNAATDYELDYIQKSKKTISQAKSIEPNFSIKDGILTAYIPIMTKPVCLSCHGSSSAIHTDVKAKLKELYPEDKAVNYQEGDLRGIWIIKMRAIK